MRDISRAGGGVQGSQWKMTASVKLQTEAVGPRGGEDCHSLHSHLSKSIETSPIADTISCHETDGQGDIKET